MNNRTQMMKIENPELFYLFRRAFGLFLLFVFICFNAQVELVGDIVVINNLQDSAVYISSGTYVHNSETIKKNKDRKTLIATSKHSKSTKGTIQKLTVSKKPAIKPNVTYGYLPLRRRHVLNLESVIKTLCTNINNHHKKHFASMMNCFSSDTFLHFNSEMLSKSTDRKLQYFHTHFRTRPPPKLC